MKNFIYLIVISTVFLSCGNAKLLTDAQKQKIQAWGITKDFVIESNWAKPMVTTAFNQVGISGILGPGNTSGSIDLTTNVNYFKKKGDSLVAYLPYFGERNMGGGYNNTIAIELEGIPTESEIIFNEAKQRAEMRFQIRQKDDHELYNILVMIFGNNSTRIDVTSSERSMITYDGHIKELTE